MSIASVKIRCITCKKDYKITYNCKGCSQNFCINHLAEHHRQLGKQLDEIEDRRNVFRQILSEQTKDLQEHLLLQQINQWKENSIKKIKQTANETRQLLIKHTNVYIEKININLTQL